MADMGSPLQRIGAPPRDRRPGLGIALRLRNQEPVEANQWYDIRIIIRSNHGECYMDGKLKYD